MELVNKGPVLDGGNLHRIRTCVYGSGGFTEDSRGTSVFHLAARTLVTTVSWKPESRVSIRDEAPSLNIDTGIGRLILETLVLNLQPSYELPKEAILNLPYFLRISP